MAAFQSPKARDTIDWGSRQDRAGTQEFRRRPMQIERITHDPAVMGGKPCIRGLRVTVGTILGLLASGKSRERILQAYPYLEPEDIDAALAYAAWRLEEREEPLVVP
jgi:uncharacterized protein (DUF433 family)